MKRLLVLFFLVNASMLYAQNFTSHGIANMEVISREDYIHAYKHRDELKVKKRTKGKKAKRIFESFRLSNYGQKWFEICENDIYEYISYYALPPDNKNYIVNIDIYGASNYRSYLLRENNEVDSIEMFGLGCLTSKLVYFSAEDSDSDELVWCQWYDLKEGKVKLLADLRETTYDYYIRPISFDIPSIFADNKGFYYLRIENKSDENKCFYYRITLAPQKADEQ